MMDYSALKNLDQDIRNLPSRQPWAYALIIVGTVTSLGLLAVPKTAGLGALALISVMSGGIIGSIYEWKKSSKLRDQAYAVFAKDNEMVYSPTTSEFGSGSLFLNGYDKKGSTEFKGEIDGLPFRLFQYNYSSGGGKHSRNYDAMVARIVLPRALPHMVIDSEVENDETGNSILPLNFDASQKIELEGDFARYFNLYAPDKYGVTALTVLAPDVMDCLMRNAALCDIEIIDNNMYFYWPNVARKPEEFETIFRSVDAVVKETRKVLTRQDIYATDNQRRLHSEVNAKGVRLKSNGLKFVLPAIVLGILPYLAGFLPAFNNKAVIIPQIVSVIILIVPVMTIYGLITRQRKLKKLKEFQKRFAQYRDKETLKQ